MSLSCSCVFDLIGAGFDWYWMGHSGMVYRYPDRRKKCSSCGQVIQWGEESIEFYRYRDPKSDIEESIYGDQVRLASYFMCEKCSGLVVALEEMGYCYDISEPLQDQIAEFAEDNGGHL